MLGALPLLAGCNQSPSPANVSVDAGPPKLRPADAGPCPQPYCPETVYDRTGEPARPRRGIEVDGTTLYWCELTNSESVVRAAPKDGSGPLRTLGRWFEFAFNRALVSDETHLYWLNVDETGNWPALVRVDKDGGDPQATPIPILGDEKLSDFGPIAGTPDAILLASVGCRRVLRVPKDGSAIQSWTVSPTGSGGGVTPLEFFDGLVYCANGPYIHRIDPVTGVIMQVATGQDHAGPMAMINGSLYFVNNRSGPGGRDENLAVLSLASGAVQDLGTAPGLQAGHLHYDEPRHTLYWFTGLNFQTAELAAYDVNASAPPVVLLDGQDIMGDSAADADYLYWQSDHAITRLRKWP